MPSIKKHKDDSSSPLPTTWLCLLTTLMPESSDLPKMVITSPNLCVLKGSWLTRKAVLGQVAMRMCRLGSKFRRPVSCSSYELSIIIDSSCHWATELAVVPVLRGCSSSLSSTLDTPATSLLHTNYVSDYWLHVIIIMLMFLWDMQILIYNP